MKKDNKFIYFIYSFWICLFLFTIFCFHYSYNLHKKNIPTAKNGVIDLTRWNFKKYGKLPLNGEWEFYWGNLYTPEDFASSTPPQKTTLVNIPGSFSKSNLDNLSLPSKSYGTYRIRVKTNGIKNHYAIKTEFISTSHKLWADGKVVTHTGKVGTKKDDNIPQMISSIGNFNTNSNEFDIIVQISNFDVNIPQMDSIFIGTEEQILKAKTKGIAFDFLIFGSTFIMGIYQLSLYHKRRNEKSPLFFSIICLIIAIRTLFVGERFVVNMFPNFNWYIQVKICYMTFLTYITIFLIYIDNLYNHCINKKFILFSNFSTCIYCILILLLPPVYYDRLLIPYEIIPIITLIYILCRLSMLLFIKKQPCGLIILGTFAILATNVNDILYEYSLIQTGSYAALGILIFMITQSYESAERFSKAFSHIEDLSYKLKSMDKLKDEFLVNTSNELRVPLNGILSLTETLLKDSKNLTKEQLLSLNLINSSSIKLSNLVNDLMDFSRLNNNDITLYKKPLNLKQLVEVVIFFCYPSAKNKNLIINNNIPNNLPPVFADETRLKQILYNIISNSIKFTKVGSVTINATSSNNYITISIKDTGIGIPKDNLSNIFDSYEKFKNNDHLSYGGIGIGLNISRRLIELHGGHISVESTVGVGSKFIFTLPISYSKNYQNSFSQNILNLSSDEEVKFSCEFNDKQSCKHKILVVDDDSLTLKVLEELLTSEDFYVITTSSGDNALKIINSDLSLDLVILNTMLPDMLGYEVCSILRKNFSLFNLPILMLTSDNRPESLVASFKCGANDYLKKPLDKLELISRVKTLITIKDSVSEALNLQKQISDTNKKVEELKDDVSKNQKKLNQILEYDKLKTEFFANISHELRTPLNVIWSSLQLIDTLDPHITLGQDNIKNYFNIMKQNSLRLIRLINNLIDITKIDGNYLTLDSTTQNIVYVVEEVSLSVAKYIECHGINLIFDTDIEEKLMSFDSDKIERIILNLLSNAVKFTPKNGTIEINLYDLGDRIRISVKDNGIGIPEDKLNQIFERFTQVDKSLSRKNEGSGIGLSLVKSLVELHGGKVWAKSVYGSGSEFIVELPVIIEENITVKYDTINYDTTSKYVDRIHIEFSDIYM